MKSLISNRASIKRHVVAGLALFVLIAGGVGGWAATTEISGAVVASGSVVVDGNVKKVQHSTGGIIGEILVHNGDKVDKGDVLFRLDATVETANLSIINERLVNFQARHARLKAERDGKPKVLFSKELISDATASTAGVRSAEQQLFELRRRAKVGKKMQLRQRIRQFRSEIEGLTVQQRAKLREIEFSKIELRSARQLRKKKLMSIARMTALERDATRLEGENGQLVSRIASVEGRITETELKIIQVDRDLASEVATQLSQVETSISEYIQRKAAAQDKLNRIDVRAPQSGVVHASTIHTTGGVLKAGETAMLVVPVAEALTVEVQVAPQDIDQLRKAQPALLRFSAFNQRTTPEVTGKVDHVAADVTRDPEAGVSYYEVRIEIEKDQLSRLGRVSVKPGMPVEAFIKTEQRNVLSYLVKPLRDQAMRAFREE